MTTESLQRIDHVAWVRKVNDRWIVHHGLNASLTAYLDHLAKSDPERLLHSCRLAHRLVHSIGPEEDPKPWFYGSAFALATLPEAHRFLVGHPLIASVVPALQTEETLPAALQRTAPATVDKIRRLRETLKRLTGD